MVLYPKLEWSLSQPFSLHASVHGGVDVEPVGMVFWDDQTPGQIYSVCALLNRACGGSKNAMESYLTVFCPSLHSVGRGPSGTRCQMGIKSRSHHSGA